MQILTLRPGHRALGFACFVDAGAGPAVQGTLRLADAADLRVSLEAALDEILKEHCGALPAPELVVIRCAHDGGAFDGPRAATPEVLAALRSVAGAAPLHIPPACDTASVLLRSTPGLPVVFAFETAFFARLPERERVYALDEATRNAIHAVRWGFHGLFHGEAAGVAARSHRSAGHRSVARIVSICLEPKPEVAAVLGARPLMVTSGATPLEGLPGERASGETDAGIILELARRQDLGAEELNELFTRACGLSVLCEREADLADILNSDDDSTRLARDVFRHRLLLACGAAAAALGGVDTLVFSGRYAATATALQGPLVRSLARALPGARTVIDVLTLERGLDRILATVGEEAWLHRRAS